MIFPSPIFLLVFMPAVLLGWYALKSARARLFLLAAASFLFYGWWDYRFVALMLASTILDFVCGQRIHQALNNRTSTPTTRDRQHARSWLLASIAGNMSALGFFKYYNFFADSLGTSLESIGLGVSLPTLNVVLPIGISFYTFQSMSYSIDIYRGVCRPTADFLRFSAFVSLFPQLVAGPIVRYSDIGKQLDTVPYARADCDRIAGGSWLFVIGMFKKVAIADSLAPVAAMAFDSGGSVQLLTAWAGAICYSFQLYYDFSGYSDMARGLGMMLGFDFPINFDSPYKSASISEFWTRWHITLSRWLRDYLYIPLGGSHTTKFKTARNLGITMFLGGLWHGAGWQFVAWGLYHGALLAIHSAWRKVTPSRLPRPLCIAGTFLLVTIGWVLFRSTSLTHAMEMLAAMVGANGLEPLVHRSLTLGVNVPAIYVQFSGVHGLLFLCAVAAAALFAPNSQDVRKPQHPAFAVAIAGAVVVMMTTFGAESPFLYFQF